MSQEGADPILEIYTQRLEDMFFDELPTHSIDGRYGSELGAGGVVIAEGIYSNLNSGNLSPRDLLSVINEMRNQVSFPPHADLAAAISAPNGIAETFYAEFLQSQGINATQAIAPGNLAAFGDWGVLDTALGGTLDPTFLEDNFLRVINEYIRSEFFSNETVPANIYDDFHEGWRNFLGTSNYLNTNAFTDTFFSAHQASTFTATNITSYRDLYFAFVPNATQEAFEARLATFYQDCIDDQGYFLPGHFAAEWYQAVQVERLEQFVGTAVDGTGSEQVRIIFSVFQLLVDMIGTLQRVAATQARRLTFYANMQRAFTTLISAIPNLTPDDVERLTDSFGSGGNVNRDRRNSILQSVQATNQAYTEQLRSFRSVWSDEARSHQTTVNQSNETVNQQANLSTALLQQMSTILAAIFR